MSEAMPADTTAQTTTNPLTDLTGFQIELLVAIDSHDDRPSGQMVKTRWETQNGETTTHGRVYPNLDELIDGGFVRRGQHDRRTNWYELTTDGEQALENYAEFVAGE